MWSAGSSGGGIHLRCRIVGGGKNPFSATVFAKLSSSSNITYLAKTFIELSETAGIDSSTVCDRRQFDQRVDSVFGSSGVCVRRRCPRGKGSGKNGDSRQHPWKVGDCSQHPRRHGYGGGLPEQVASDYIFAEGDCGGQSRNRR